jgi:hypothetical protein
VRPRAAGSGLLLVLALALPARRAQGEDPAPEGGPPAPAPDPVEEVEARLKSTGIDDALRAAVRRAVERGAAFLRTRQRDHGGFVPPLVIDGTAVTASRFEAGATALCGLALLHTGLPDAVEAARRAREHLFVEGPVRETVEAFTYDSALVALLLAAERVAPDDLAATAKRLVRWQRSRGWWDYGEAPSDANLSTTQFAALGLAAAARRGVEVPARTWKAIATAHLEAQGKDGRWDYHPAKPRDLGAAPSPYPQGTFMGLANLLLVEAVLGADPKKDTGLLKRVAEARRRALVALETDGPAFLRTLERGLPGSTFHDLFPYYGLYALEKACVFAGVEGWGDVRWYERGARLLVRRQGEDGSWPALRKGKMTVAVNKESVSVDPEDERIRTAFALLFLLRVPETDRPTTPSPPPVTTPSEPGPPPVTPGPR